MKHSSFLFNFSIPLSPFFEPGNAKKWRAPTDASSRRSRWSRRWRWPAEEVSLVRGGREREGREREREGRERPASKGFDRNCQTEFAAAFAALPVLSSPVTSRASPSCARPLLFLGASLTNTARETGGNKIAFLSSGSQIVLFSLIKHLFFSPHPSPKTNTAPQLSTPPPKRPRAR